MEWYYVWWPWLTSKRVAQVCQHQLSFLFSLTNVLLIRSDPLSSWLVGELFSLPVCGSEFLQIASPQLASQIPRFAAEQPEVNIPQLNKFDVGEDFCFILSDRLRWKLWLRSESNSTILNQSIPLWVCHQASLRNAFQQVNRTRFVQRETWFIVRRLRI